MSRLFTPSEGYRPHYFPWAYEYWDKQQKMHWLADEVPLAEDVKDWNTNLTEPEKNLIKNVLRFFTQADASVSENYIMNYLPIFKPVELQMMLLSFASSETVHIASYARLLETLGLPDNEFTAFLQIKEMKDKYSYFDNFSVDNTREIAKTLAGFGAFTEGLQLYSSFCMLFNFSRYGKMKGTGQLITWSIRDEAVHCEGLIRLFHALLAEHPGLLDEDLKKEIEDICRTIVSHEDAFIDLAFELGSVPGLTAEEVKTYIRFVADRRMEQLGFDTIYGVTKNPLPWMDEITGNIEFANFFEATVTEYVKNSTTGDWGDAF